MAGGEGEERVRGDIALESSTCRSVGGGVPRPGSNAAVSRVIASVLSSRCRNGPKVRGRQADHLNFRTVEEWRNLGMMRGTFSSHIP